MRNGVVYGMLPGLAGGAAMIATEKAEQPLSGRPISPVPAHTLTLEWLLRVDANVPIARSSWGML